MLDTVSNVLQLLSGVFTCLAILSSLILAVMMSLTGRAIYWLFLTISFTLLLSDIVVSVFFFTLAEIKQPSHIIPTVLLSFPVLAYLIWHWAQKSFCTWVAQKGTPKRIDFDNAVFNPFSFPPVAAQNQNFDKWFLIASASGSLLILIPSVILGAHWTGRYTSEIQFLGASVCIYIFLLFCVGIISLNFAEYLWIRQWEKEKGRVIHLSFMMKRGR